MFGKHCKLIRALIVFIILSLCQSASAFTGDTQSPAYDQMKRRYMDDFLHSRKLDHNLKSVMYDMTARGITRNNAVKFNAETFSNPLVRVDQRGLVQTYINLSSVDDIEKKRSQLESYGAAIEIMNREDRTVQAWIPYESIDGIAGLPFVKRIAPPDYGIMRSGSVTTQGDTILHADQLRSLGYDGSGIKVGVISDGANNRSNAQATDDLPPDIAVYGACNPAVTFTTCNEGTAMLEIVHDLAPGAGLGFCGAYTSEEFKKCVKDLEEVFGADIIVDDIGFFGEPYFEDGPIAQKVASAVANGVVYASSAGNYAQTHYQGMYSDSGYGSHDHNFGGGDRTLYFTSPYGPVAFYLQWSNSFGLAADNYDLCLYSSTGSTPLYCSENIQNGDDDPFEALGLMCNSTGGCAGNIVIRKISGAAQELELFLINATPTQFIVTADSIFGHPAVPGALSAAAIDVNDYGYDTIETYSSRGPSTILFPVHETRQKPDVTAVDGVSVTGAGNFGSPVGHFHGTSASAPHVAGVAALLKEKFGNSIDAINAMKNNSVDLGTSGMDYVFGAGRIDAYAAATGQTHYSYDDTAAYSWIDATVGTDALITTSSKTINIGFDFIFYGNTYTTVTVSPYGYLTFGSSGTSSANTSIPYTGIPNNMIAPFWDYLYYSPGGKIYYLLTGTAPDRQLTIEWYNMHSFWYSNGEIVFEATLHESTNEIIFQYQDVVFGSPDYDYGASGTVGIENSSGGSGLKYSYNTVSLSNSSAIRFYLSSLTPPSYPPDSPAGLSAASASSGRIHLLWTDNSSDETGFKIERMAWTSGTYEQVATVSADITSFIDTDLDEATAYYYRVRAFNAAGDSSFSNESSATTWPEAPENLSAYAVSSGQIDLSWTDKSSGEMGYKIERMAGSGGTYTQIAAVGANVTAYSDTALSGPSDYYYRVRVYSVSGDSFYSNEASATTASSDGGSSDGGGGSASDGGGGGGGGGGACFIATAAYGSYMADEVVVLRTFRDTYLLTNIIGSLFVELYYAYSPPMADFIRTHEAMRTGARYMLAPLVYGVKYPGTFGVLLLSVCAATAFIMIRRRSKR